jgi:hypothetical protein
MMAMSKSCLMVRTISLLAETMLINTCHTVVRLQQTMCIEG